MLIYSTKHKILPHIVSAVLISAFLLSGMPSYSFADSRDSALAPPLATANPGFRNDWAFVKISESICEILELAEKQNLQNPKDILIPLIKRRLRGSLKTIREEFDINGIENIWEGEKIKGFSLPYKRNGRIAYNLVYNRQGGDMKIPMKDGTNVWMEVVPLEQTSSLPIVKKAALALKGRLKKDLAVIAEFGPRYSGSEADIKTAKYFADRMKECGFVVEEEEFEAPIFRDKGSFISIGDEILSAKSYMYSCGTTTEGIRAGVVFVGEEEDIAKINCKGKFVVITLKQEDLKDNFEREEIELSRNGAKGIILVSPTDSVFVGSVESGCFDPARRFLIKDSGVKEIPVIGISKSDGQKLFTRHSKEPDIEIQLISEVVNSKAQLSNVIAVKKGKKCPEKEIVILGHRDTVGNLGANDNGSGQVVMMELGGLLKDAKTDYTIKLISTCAEEELGSVGASDYIMRHKAELKDIEALIDVDMVGGDELLLVTQGEWDGTTLLVKYSGELNEGLYKLARELGIDYLRKDKCPLGTPDSGRFAQEGVPSAWLWSPDSEFYHTDNDTVENVNFGTVGDVVKLLYRFVSKESSPRPDNMEFKARNSASGLRTERETARGNFRIIPRKEGRHTIYDLIDVKNNNSISVLPTFGANMISMVISGEDIICGPKNLNELEEWPTHSGMPVLFPTPSFLEGNQFAFDKVTCKFDPNMKDAQGHPIFMHGIVMNKEWKAEPDISDEGAFITCSISSKDHPDMQRQYPFQFEMSITYLLAKDGSVRITPRIKNTGTSRLPFGLGFHPYFNISGRSTCKVKVPLDHAWDYRGDAGSKNTLRSLYGPFDLTGGRLLSELTKTAILTAKGPIKNNTASEIIDEGHGRVIRIVSSAAYRNIVVFSPEGKDFVSIEPWTSRPDGANLGEKGGMTILEPGANFSAPVTIKIEDGIRGKILSEGDEGYKLFESAVNLQVDSLYIDPNIPEETEKTLGRSYSNIFDPGKIMSSSIRHNEMRISYDERDKLNPFRVTMTYGIEKVTFLFGKESADSIMGKIFAYEKSIHEGLEIARDSTGDIVSVNAGREKLFMLLTDPKPAIRRFAAKAISTDRDVRKVAEALKRAIYEERLYRAKNSQLEVARNISTYLFYLEKLDRSVVMDILEADKNSENADISRLAASVIGALNESSDTEPAQ